MILATLMPLLAMPIDPFSYDSFSYDKHYSYYDYYNYMRHVSSHSDENYSYENTYMLLTQQEQNHQIFLAQINAGLGELKAFYEKLSEKINNMFLLTGTLFPPNVQTTSLTSSNSRAASNVVGVEASSRTSLKSQ